jgi:hypothetical protein
VGQLRQAWRDLAGETHELRRIHRNPIDREGMLRWFATHGGRWQLG